MIKNAGQPCLAIEGSHNTRTLWWLPQLTNITFYSSFEENCQQIINDSSQTSLNLLPKETPSTNRITPKEKATLQII